MPDTSHERVYSEEEIGRILKEAASLQQSEGSRAITGLSLAELLELAHESGIDPRHVESVALALADRTDQDAGSFLGRPLQISVKRRIQGSVSDETFARMVSMARRKLRKTGTTSQAGSTREWSVQSQVGASTSLTLREYEDHTDLEIYWTESQVMPIPFVIVPLIGIVLWLGIIINDWGLTGLTAASAIAAMLLVYILSPLLLFRAITRSHRRTIHALAGGVTDLAREAGRHELAEPEGGELADLLPDIDAEQADPELSHSFREHTR